MTQSVQDTHLNTLVQSVQELRARWNDETCVRKLLCQQSPRRSQSARHSPDEGVVRGWIVISKQNARGPHGALSTRYFIAYVTFRLLWRRAAALRHTHSQCSRRGSLYPSHTFKKKGLSKIDVFCDLEEKRNPSLLLLWLIKVPRYG